MAWHIFEKLLEGVANYSPFIGKVWITFLFLFRLIMVVSIGDTVYGDEQSNFVCNTLQPGCENVCFNQFSPISQIRFYAVQILFVGTPSIAFIVYAMHRMTTIPPASESSRSDGVADDGKTDEIVRRRKKRNRDSKTIEEPNTARSKSSTGANSLPKYDEVIRNGVKITISSSSQESRPDSKSEFLLRPENNDENVLESEAVDRRSKLRRYIAQEGEKDKKATTTKVKRKMVYSSQGSSEVVKTPGIARAYVAQALLRTAIEVGFLYIQYYMYGFTVTSMYLCKGFPCPREVECFVSRPMEKTLFLQFMYAMTFLSLLLNLIEIYLLASKWVRRTCCKSGKNKESVALDDRFPMEEVIIDRHQGRRLYRRARMPNTFPDLGPFPRSADEVGGSSGNETMDSDYRFYDL